MSTHVRKLMVMLRDPDSQMDDIVLEISRDITLVAQVLRMINSSYYDLPNKIETLEQAVSLIGFSKVWDLLMSTSVMTVLIGREKELWAHSYSSSVLMRQMIQEERVNCLAIMPLVMLMHDIGKLVLITYNATTYKLVETISDETRVSAHHIEEERLGVTHNEAGMWLMDAWELEEEYGLLTCNHHNRDADSIPEGFATEVALMQIVDYCDNVARSVPFERPDEDVLLYGGLSHIDIGKWTSRQRETIHELSHQRM